MNIEWIQSPDLGISGNMEHHGTKTDPALSFGLQSYQQSRPTNSVVDKHFLFFLSSCHERIQMQLLDIIVVKTLDTFCHVLMISHE